MVILQQPLYSHDIAPSDFYFICWKKKKKNEWYKCDYMEEVKSTIMAFLKEKLHSFYKKWIKDHEMVTEIGYF